MASRQLPRDGEYSLSSVVVARRFIRGLALSSSAGYNATFRDVSLAILQVFFPLFSHFIGQLDFESFGNASRQKLGGRVFFFFFFFLFHSSFLYCLLVTMGRGVGRGKVLKTVCYDSLNREYTLGFVRTSF